MDAIWIVSANAGRARFFSQVNPSSALVEISDMVNAAARLRTAETETDELGQRSAAKSRHNGTAAQPSGYEPNQSPAQHQTEIFARNVADFLRKAQSEQRYRQLYIMAAPEFLGVLRRLLDANVSASIGLEVSKDYTQLNGNQLAEQIEAWRP